jgi:hypothetical protein
MRRCVGRSCWSRSRGCTAESTALACRARLAWVGVGGMSGPAVGSADRWLAALFLVNSLGLQAPTGLGRRGWHVGTRCKYVPVSSCVAIHGNTWSRHPTHTAPSTVGWCAWERSTAGRIGRLTFLLDQSSSFHAGVEPTVGRLLLTRFYAVDSSHRRRRPFRARAVRPCRDRRAPWMAPVEPPWVRAHCLRGTASHAFERTAASGWAGPRSGVYGASRLGMAALAQHGAANSRMQPGQQCLEPARGG